MSEEAGPKILVVDDEAPVLKLVRRVLMRAKFDVLAAEDGERALELVAQEPVAAAVLDLTLPGIDGAEVARRLRERFAGLPVIITSGYDEATARARASGIDDAVFLQKPFTPKVLTEAVSKLV